MQRDTLEYAMTTTDTSTRKKSAAKRQRNLVLRVRVLPSESEDSFREVLSRANSKLPRNGTTADQEREILATLTKRRSESPEQIDPCGCDALPSLTIETQMVFVLAIPQGNHRRAFFLSSCGIPPTPLFIAGANG